MVGDWGKYHKNDKNYDDNADADDDDLRVGGDDADDDDVNDNADYMMIQGWGVIGEKLEL